MVKRDESGQAVVLVLLSLSVVLTLILYLLSRSVTDVAVSSTQEQSVRAFSAAEAGVERALVTGAGNSDQNIGYVSHVSGYAENSQEYVYPNSLASGDWATIWFMAHDSTSGNLVTADGFEGSGMTVCWGEDGTHANLETTPAIEISIYYETTRTVGDYETVKIARAAFDPNSGRNPPIPNSFDNSVDGSCDIAGTKFAFKKVIDFDSDLPAVAQHGLLFAKIKIFYNDTPQKIGVTVTGGNLPSQGQDISSTGTAGESNRRISVFRGWPEFPFASDALFSPQGITQ